MATIVPDKEYEDRLIATSYNDSRVCAAVYIEKIAAEFMSSACIRLQEKR